DITLIEPLSKALGVSVMELMSGDTVINKNVSSNILRSKFYVCPVCGNIIRTTGDAVISCCGITLPTLEAEEADEAHEIKIEKVEDEYFVTVKHEMTKTHFISFIAHLTSDKVHFVKFYPEGNAETRLQLRGKGYLYIYCNKHGLMKQRV
ncbi:MAG: GNAT family N-acetyltransferase, partial [Clostridia bacterium]|nr:GNAT family N-acetyltransferase [Clostridia bacterium]